MKFILHCGALVLRAWHASAADSAIERLTYHQFIAEVEAGHVKHVRFYNLSGIEGDIERPQGSVRFDTAHAIQPNTDPLLLRLLEEKGVTSEQLDHSSTWETSTPWFFYGLTPFGGLILVGLIVAVIFQRAAIRRLEAKVTEALHTIRMARPEASGSARSNDTLPPPA